MKTKIMGKQCLKIEPQGGEYWFSILQSMEEDAGTGKAYGVVCREELVTLRKELGALLGEDTRAQEIMELGKNAADYLNTALREYARDALLQHDIEDSDENITFFIEGYRSNI